MITEREREQIELEVAEQLRKKFTWLDMVDSVTNASSKLAGRYMHAHKIDDEAEMGFCIKDMELEHASRDPDFDYLVEKAIKDREENLRMAV